MARSPKPWWNESKGVWCSDIGGKRHTLARGRKNRKEAVERLRALVDEQNLLAEVNGAITVAGLCEKFLEDAERNLERKTYKIYQYSCQKFVDQLGRRMAHTITPTDISSFVGDILSSAQSTAEITIRNSREACRCSHIDALWLFSPSRTKASTLSVTGKPLASQQKSMQSGCQRFCAAGDA